MAITLTEKFAPYTDEQFKNESKRSLVTNQDFDWTGAHTIKVYKIQTSEMQDYGRTGPTGDNFSRYGSIADLNASTEELALKNDRSFIFNVDKLDADEAQQQVEAATALARQNVCWRRYQAHRKGPYRRKHLQRYSGSVCRAR